MNIFIPEGKNCYVCGVAFSKLVHFFPLSEQEGGVGCENTTNHQPSGGKMFLAAGGFGLVYQLLLAGNKP